MNKVFFTNLENTAISELMKAQKSIKAAVAWINFNQYSDVLETLLNSGIKIKILLNNDGINQRYNNYIQELNSKGAKIRLVNFSGIMHHKFCIIDEKLCMYGSFNWTQSANLRNIEDLNICDELNFVRDYLAEFKALWELNKQDIQLLTHPKCCKYCNNYIINILYMEPYDDYQAKIEIIQCCDCHQEVVNTDYADISVYNNILQNDELLDSCLQSGDEEMYTQLLSQNDYYIANYLTFVRTQRMGMPIIHAVALKTWKWFNKDDGEFVYKIIWKERGTDSYIEDEYEINS